MTSSRIGYPRIANGGGYFERPDHLDLPSATALAQVQTGASELLPTTTTSARIFPDVADHGEQGFAEAQVTVVASWYAGTPQPIIRSHQQGAGGALAAPEVRRSDLAGCAVKARRGLSRRIYQIRHRALGEGRQGRWIRRIDPAG